MVKISLMAEELGVSVKTIYNWIKVGKLSPIKPGYVDRVDAFEVWLSQKQLRIDISYFQVQGIKRDSNGQFKSKGDLTEG